MRLIALRDAFISRTSKHSGAIKALQFNPFRSELLATVGAKGELFISDLQNVGSPFRMGNAIARADDFDCLDWNKRTAHILATGSSGGTMTVWDVKNKKESLTLNNLGRKPVSAIAWDPVKTTRLITAIPNDTEPVILVWDLRNANAPERTLQGHDGGVLSLSWCAQDSDLLLSCGKDNRNICWNPQTGESYGEFPVVTNWTFQTRWNPHIPSLMATASFDGNIAIETIQHTKSEVDGASGGPTQTVDDDEFFSKAQTQAQGPRFTLKKSPKWLRRPCGASFSFGGKVVSHSAAAPELLKRSVIRISTFAIDNEIASSISSFEAALQENQLNKICESRIANAPSKTEKADWEVIKTLTSKTPRKDLVDYLGFSSLDDEAADGVSKIQVNGSQEEENSPLDKPSIPRSDRLSAFFDSSADGDTFLSELAATKGAKTNNPFKLYSGSESEPDCKITTALLLGHFDKALNVCLQENRMSDAFMIAICGGQDCMEKAQKAYFNQKSKGPNYIRLLASVVGKNLWDLVHNADLESWKEIMAILCTYADVKEFPDLCEALGDRLGEQLTTREEMTDHVKDASFCYLAGSKLEKVIGIWITDLGRYEKAKLRDGGQDSSFSIHARLLQSFIEKVTVFQEVTQYQDSDLSATSDWNLAPLYDRYTEYADIASAHGQLEIASRYLNLLPNNYPAAEVAKSRVYQATRKATTGKPAVIGHSQERVPPPGFRQEQESPPRRSLKGNMMDTYAPPSQVVAQNPYTPINGSYGTPGYTGPNSYQLNQSHLNTRQEPGMAPTTRSFTPLYQNLSAGPPSKNLNASASISAPSKSTYMTNWNDTPEEFFKAPVSRRGTPGIGANQPSAYQPTQQSTMGSSLGPPPKSAPSLGPPPRGGLVPPPRMSSPSSSSTQSYQQPEKPPSLANAYAPTQTSTDIPVQQQPAIARGPSPYNPPPSATPPINRYAPTQILRADSPSTQHRPPTMPGVDHPGLPSANPYAPQQTYVGPQQDQSHQATSSSGPALGSSRPLLSSSNQQNSLSTTSQAQRREAPTAPKHRESIS